MSLIERFQCHVDFSTRETSPVWRHFAIQPIAQVSCAESAEQCASHISFLSVIFITFEYYFLSLGVIFQYHIQLYTQMLLHGRDKLH
jgi:hypothetical protein